MLTNKQWTQLPIDFENHEVVRLYIGGSPPGGERDQSR